MTISTIYLPVKNPLTVEEKLQIQEMFKKDPAKEEQVKQLITITMEIKAISEQSVLLHGERIKQAQDLLSNYKNGVFSKWLVSTYGNRQTPYRMLRYYEFHQSSTRGDQYVIESCPKGCVYLLASKDNIDHEEKIALLFKYKYSSTALQAIQEELKKRVPKESKSALKIPLSSSTIDSMEKLCAKLENNFDSPAYGDSGSLGHLIKRLQKLKAGYDLP